MGILKTIYNKYGNLSNIETAFGTIDLKIDDWSGAEEQRNDLFAEYDSMSHIRKSTMVSG